MRKWALPSVLLAWLWAVAGNAMAVSIGYVESSGTVGTTYTLDNAGGQYPVVTTVLSQPGTVNGVNYTAWAYYVNDGTGSMDIYGNPVGYTTPTVGDIVKIAGVYQPYHQIPELGGVGVGTTVTKVGISATVPPPQVVTIPQIDYSTVPFNVAGYMLTLNNVKITGAGNPGSTFGINDSPGGATVTDQSGNSMQFYYWPTSYSSANANLANMAIPTGLVNMTGFVSVYGNSNVPEFSPITITPSQGPPAFWQPLAGSSNWDGATLSWSTSSGLRVSPLGDVSSSNATFDDTGLANGSTVNIVSAQYAGAITVSNSSGTYTFSGGTVTTGQMAKNGSGTLLVNSMLQSPVNLTAGTLGGNGSIGSVTVGSGATLTPGATVSTIGQLSINGNADFSAGGTYLWKFGSSLLDDSSGTAGTNWDELGISGGSINFGGGSRLLLSFANSANSPINGNSFWNSNHTWLIATGSSVPALGGSIINGSYSEGIFSLQGSLGANNLELKFTSIDQQPRNLLWSANGTKIANDGSGSWTGATWTDSSGTAAGLLFDSTRPDNATFGSTTAGGGTAVVSVTGLVTAGSLTFNGGNSAQYTLSGGTILVNSGVSALQSATLNSAMVLGYSETWSVSSGTLTANGGISQATVSGLTKTGNGTLVLQAGNTYSGGTTLSDGVIAVQASDALPANGAVATAAGTQLVLNGHNQTIGALSGGASINLGSGFFSGLTFGDSSSQTFSGVISGNGPVTYAGNGTTTLTGANTFTGNVSINAGGELQVAADGNLGNAANGIYLDNGGALGATASFSSSRTITLGSSSNGGSNNGTLDVSGSATVLTLNGQVTGYGALTKAGLGTLVLVNSNNSYPGGTVLSAGTLSISSPGAVGNGLITFTGLSPNTTLQFTSPMTLSNDLYFPVVGNKPVWLDTQGNNVTLTGQLWPTSAEYYSVALYKTGAGTLTLAAGDTTGLGTKGTTYINQGTVALTNAGGGYSALSSSPIEVSPGATLQLANVQLGFQQDRIGAGAVGYVDLSPGATQGSGSNGATLEGRGTSSYANGDIEVRLNYSANNTVNGLGTSPPYSPGSVTIQTVNPTDVLSILNSVKQYDPGYITVGNEYGNAIKTSATTYASDPTKLVTIHVTGPGPVQLQDGGVSSDTTFGGEWSVDSGVLQIGPYQQTATGWNGPYGQLLNALGFKTLNGQTYNGSGSVQGDPDMPNGVTVHSGGMFAVAVDQVNTNPNIILYNQATPVNNTPDYLRNPITLSGGTLAATGYEMDFFALTLTNSLVTAKLGGDFTVGTGTSTIATYDPIGSSGTRTVQLLGGSRTLSNSTAAFAAGTTLTYNTTWDGTLNVDGGTANGGEFDLFRDSGGTVTVASGAKINIRNGATVNVGGTEPNAALYDTTTQNSVNFGGNAGGGHLVFSRSADFTYRGNISGDLDLTQEGTGSLFLSGTNTYTGGTMVSSGTLTVVLASELPSGGGLTIGARGTFIFDPFAVGSSVVHDNGGGPVSVPEPASLTLLLALAGCAAGIWWRQRARQARCSAAQAIAHRRFIES